MRQKWCAFRARTHALTVLIAASKLPGIPQNGGRRNDGGDGAHEHSREQDLALDCGSQQGALREGPADGPSEEHGCAHTGEDQGQQHEGR